jgi:hypothetical protein
VELKINTSKTKEIRANASIENELTIGWKGAEGVNSFLFLRSVVTDLGGAEEDIKSHIYYKDMMARYNIKWIMV